MTASTSSYVFLIVVQAICAVIFLSDAIGETLHESHSVWHLTLEILACLVLLVAVLISARNLIDLIRRKASLERSLANASMAVQHVIESKFSDWSFSRSERDVASLIVKGLSTAEIARLRGTAEGTVKAQLNSIYRKADARSRSDLMSQILDAMIDRPLLDELEADKRPSFR